MKDKIFGAALVIIVAWLGWVSATARDSVDRENVSEMIAKESPYVQDRGAIEARMAQQTEAIRQQSRAQERLVEVIEKNTEAINALKVQIARGGG